MRRTALVVALALVAGMAASAAATTTFDGEHSLSGTPVLAYGGDRVAISPDGSAVAWITRIVGDASNQRRLVVADAVGTDVTPRILTEVVGSHDADVISSAFTPDSQHIVFRADLDTDETLELYVVPTDGSAGPVRLAEMVAGGNVASFAITPDSTTVVFSADALVDEQRELFAVPVDGSAAPVVLSQPPVAGGAVTSFELTTDGSRVVFLGDLRMDGRNDLFLVPVDGSDTSHAISKAPTGLSVTRFGLAADDPDIVVYSGELTTAGDEAVYVRGLTGVTAQRQVSVHDVAGSDVVSFALTPDGDHIVYSGRLAGPESDLFARPSDLSMGQERLNARDGGTPGEVFNFTLVPGSSRVLFEAELFAPGEELVFSAPLDASSKAVVLSPPPNGAQTVTGVDASPDGQFAVYSVNKGGNSVLWVSPVDGSAAAAKVTDNVHPTTTAYLAAITSDNRAIFGSDEITADAVDLWVRPLDLRIDAIRVNDPVPVGTSVGLVNLAPDEDYIQYGADIDGSGFPTVLASSFGLPPAPASEVAIRTVGHHDVTVSWVSSPGTGVEQYQVTATPQSERRAAEVVTAAVPADQNAATLTSLVPGMTYDLVVAAQSEAGAAPSPVVSFTTTGMQVVRIAGQDRYETAAKVALASFDPDDVDVVYLATGQNFPDALAGGPLAAANDAPILLTPSGELTKVTADALATLGPTMVVGLGGTSAINPGTMDAAAKAAGGASTSRLAGQDRFETAAKIAAALPAGFDTVYLATGRNYPDALAGGPATAGAPILLVEQDGLPPETAAALATIKPAKIVVLGGPVAVSDPVLAAAKKAAGGAATSRIAGPNRYATAAEIAGLVGTTDTVYVAVGTNYPDALAAGPAAEAEGAPIVLTTALALPAETLALLQAMPHLHRVVVLGGPVAVSTDVATKLATLLH